MHTRAASFDPGVTGAIAISQDGRVVEVHDMPLMIEGTRKIPNGAAIADLLRKSNVTVAIIEWVVPMGSKADRDGVVRKRGIKTTGDFMYGAGVLFGAATALGIAVEFVTPMKWKKDQVLVGKTKEASRSLAIRRFPHLAAMLKRKKDEGRAEAILILDWFLRRLGSVKPPVPALP